MSEGGILADTPESIELMGLIYLKRDLKILRSGMRLRYSARNLAKRLTGLKTNNLDKLIEAVEQLIQTKGENPQARFKRV